MPEDMVAIANIAEGPDWRLARPGLHCRHRGCRRPAKFEFLRGVKRLQWWAYCDDLEHCFYRVLIDGDLFFVFEAYPPPEVAQSFRAVEP